MPESQTPLLNAIGEGLADLSPSELKVFALAVLHGVPVTRLAGAAQENVDVLIGAQKKLRKFLSERGFGTSELEKPSTRGR